MKRTLMCLATIFFATAAKAQEPPPPPKPTAEHLILAAFEGTWDASMKIYMAPGAQPIVSKLVETNEVMTGGLWVLSKFEGSFGPGKFEGRGQFGYDPVKKKYISTWVVSTSPSLLVLEGTYDAKSKSISYLDDGFDSDHKVKFTRRLVITMKDDVTRDMTVYMKYEGMTEEAKFVEFSYTKRK